MAFVHIQEVLADPLRRFTIRDKQFVVSNLLMLLWQDYDHALKEWVATNNIEAMYFGTIQRDQTVDTLLNLNLQTAEKGKSLGEVPAIFGRA